MKKISFKTPDGDHVQLHLTSVYKEINDFPLVITLVNKVLRLEKNIDEVLQSFKIKMKKYRIENNYTQLALAYELGLSDRHIQRLESGDNSPSLEVLVKLSTLFQVPVNELI